MSAKKGETPDMSKFEGNGLSFKAKLIGVEDVPEARGDQMCQEMLTKLKNAVRVSGEHKQKIFVNVTLEGLKIVDAVSLAANQNKKKNESKGSKAGDESEETVKEPSDGVASAVLHSHAVHRISFISRDVTDTRAFGYIYGETNDTHKFYAIKTASAAEQLVYTIRDLFQAVYDMKKKEMEEAKLKLEKGEIAADGTTQDGEGNSQTPGNGSTSGTGQTPQTKANADGENIYSVPPNNAPVNPAPQAEQASNLLDLEDQTEHILKGIEQIKNLEFDSIAETQQQMSPVSPPVAGSNPLAGLAGPPGAAAPNADPWGMAAPAAPAAPSSSSALGDLAGLQTSSFPSIPGMQPFPGQAFPMQGGFGAQPGFGRGAGGLPVSNDPFGNDPFSMNAQQRPAAAPGGFPASNPFGAGGGFAPQQQQQFGAVPPRGMMPAATVPGMMPPGAPGFMPPGQAFPGQMGVAPRAANPFGMGFPQMPAAQPQQQGNLFGDSGADPNLLQPMKKDDGSGQKDDAAQAGPKQNLREDLFGDLLDMKKTATSTAGDSPKDLFAKASASEKKSMNSLMAGGPPGSNNNAAPQNSPFGDAFGAPLQPVNGNGNTSEKSLFD